MINANTLIISVLGVTMAFLLVLIGVGILYVLYRLKEVKTLLEEGFHVNIVQDNIPNRLGEYDYE